MVKDRELSTGVWLYVSIVEVFVYSQFGGGNMVLLLLPMEESF